MAQQTATMGVRNVDQLAGIIDIQGDITAASEHTLMDAYNRAGAEQLRVVILNFSGLEYMNSGGIGLLVTLLVRTNRQRQRLLAYGLTEHYREIFELTRLDEAVEIHGSKQEALAAAGAP